MQCALRVNSELELPENYRDAEVHTIPMSSFLAVMSERIQTVHRLHPDVRIVNIDAIDIEDYTSLRCACFIHSNNQEGKVGSASDRSTKRKFL